jgi:uncharacterized protein
VNPTLLAVGRAPVPGRAKTRLAASIGDRAAAELAAAALLDTLDALVTAAARLRTGPAVVAITGDLTRAARARELGLALRHCRVVPQRGVGLGARLAAAHVDAAGPAGGPVLQIGTDTPQVDAGLLLDCAAALTRADAVLGPAPDGGWWLLGVRRAATVAAIRDVEMSTPRTAALTRAALLAAGATLAEAPARCDVDLIDDALAVAELAPGTRFAADVARLPGLGRPGVPGRPAAGVRS